MWCLRWWLHLILLYPVTANCCHVAVYIYLKLHELVYDVRCCSKLLESYKMCHDVEVVRDWVHAYSFKDECSCPRAFAQQRWGLMPWSFCSIATRAYALGVYLCSKRRGLMPWIGTTCMIKMIELHSRVRVALSCC